MTSTLSCRTRILRVFLCLLSIAIYSSSICNCLETERDRLEPEDVMGDVEMSRGPISSPAFLGSGRSILQFSNQSNDSSSDLVCCCPVGGGQYRPFDYEFPSPSASCCCNTTDVCTQCSSSESFNSVCGSGQVCGILLLMATLIGTLAVTICVTGVFLARRRRQRNATLDQFVSVSTASGVQHARRSQILNISEDQLKELYIAQVPEGEHVEEIKECPICLDSVPVENGIWSIFPCGHGSCTICVNDLLRHSSRRVNSTTCAVLCPLCRTLAVAPTGEQNEPRIRVQGVEDDVEQQREMQNEDIPAPEEQVQTVDVVEDAEQLDTAEPVEIVVVEHQRHS
jgi:hypothetical protein